MKLKDNNKIDELFHAVLVIQDYCLNQWHCSHCLIKSVCDSFHVDNSPLTWDMSCFEIKKEKNHAK